MKRRILSIIVMSCLFLPSVGVGDAMPFAVKPYLEVPTVSGDQRVVRVFFSPHCAFSFDYLHFFKNLSATLPSSMFFHYTPVINTRDGLPYAVSFLAVQRYFPTYIANFVEASLMAVQQKGWSLDWDKLDRIGQAAHLPTRVSLLVNQNKDVLEEDLRALKLLQSSLRITNTPSVTVAGTYVVTPEITYGDAALFSELVNGIISMTQ